MTTHREIRGKSWEKIFDAKVMKNSQSQGKLNCFANILENLDILFPCFVKG